MYENLTNYLPMLQSGETCVEDDEVVAKGEDGSISIGDYRYKPWARELMRAVQSYRVQYTDVLKARGYDPNSEPSRLPVDGDPELALALLTWAVRGERFCSGTFAGAVESGLVERCLGALRGIDEAEE